MLLLLLHAIHFRQLRALLQRSLLQEQAPVRVARLQLRHLLLDLHLQLPLLQLRHLLRDHLLLELLLQALLLELSREEMLLLLRGRRSANDTTATDAAVHRPR